jgi:hypothetical protein
MEIRYSKGNLYVNDFFDGLKFYPVTFQQKSGIKRVVLVMYNVFGRAGLLQQGPGLTRCVILRVSCSG